MTAILAPPAPTIRSGRAPRRAAAVPGATSDSSAPTVLEHATMGTRVTLVLIHLALAAVLVTELRRDSRSV